MRVYIYQANLWCEDCGADIRRSLRAEGKKPDLNDYDSDDYPMGPYPDGGGESDTPEHCAAGETCLNRIVVKSGRTRYKIGAWLENDLTEEGLQYLREAIKGHGLMTRRWRKWYRDELTNWGVKTWTRTRR